MDAVWYRNFDPVLRGIGEQLVQSDLDAFLQFEVDQRSAVNAYMRAGSRPSPGPRRSPVASGGTAFPDSALSPLDTAEKTAYKRRVYNAHVAAAAKRAGRTFGSDLPAGSASPLVERGQRMRSDAAAACQQLLAKARADLAIAQGEAEDLATAATSIGAGSGSPLCDAGALHLGVALPAVLRRDEQDARRRKRWGAWRRRRDDHGEVLLDAESCPRLRQPHERHRHGLLVARQGRRGAWARTSRRTDLWRASWLSSSTARCARRRAQLQAPRHRSLALGVPHVNADRPVANRSVLTRPCGTRSPT